MQDSIMEGNGFGNRQIDWLISVKLCSEVVQVLEHYLFFSITMSNGHYYFSSVL